MASYLSRYYSVGALGGSSFGVGYGDVKCGVGPSTIHITSKTFIVGLMV